MTLRPIVVLAALPAAAVWALALAAVAQTPAPPAGSAAGPLGPPPGAPGRGASAPDQPAGSAGAQGPAAPAPASSSAPPPPAPGAPAPALSSPAPPPPVYGQPGQYGAPAYYPPPGYYGAPGYYPPPGYYPYPVRPPPPPAPEGAHLHDGFYLRLAFGAAYVHDSGSGAGDATYTLGGFGPAFEALVGGTPARGLVLGGGVLAMTASKPKSGNGSASLDSVTLTSVGAFGDYYFDPAGGLHAQAFVGLASMSFTHQSGVGSTASEEPSGLFMAAGVGYDWWIGAQWSLGVLGRLAYAPLSLDVANYTEHDAFVVPALLVDVTYH